jgi:hypothetical protein
MADYQLKGTQAVKVIICLSWRQKYKAITYHRES